MVMMRFAFSLLAALVLSASALSAKADPMDQQSGPMGMERMQQWSADHQALLDAKLAGLKAGLKLTPDEEKLWGPFEVAVRDAAKIRMEHMRAMMDRMRGMEDAERRSPVDHIEAMATHMSEAASALTKIADTAKPFYASLDESQKRVFGWLGRELLMMGHDHPGMGMMGHEGMGMMRHGMGTMHRGPDEDSFDDE
jgi:zinc resistance-associated protein